MNYKKKYIKYKKKYLQLKNYNNLVGGKKKEPNNNINILDNFENKQWNYWRSISLEKRMSIIKKLTQRRFNGLLKIEIRNKKIITDNYERENESSKNCIKSILSALKHIVHDLPDCIFFLYCKPGYGYRIEKKLKLAVPIFCFAKPRNKPEKIIIPDFTFFNTKIDNRELNWDEQKEIILKKCQNLKKQKNIIYFRGADSTDVTDLRKKIGRFIDNSIIIIANEGKMREPMYNFCKYKYLLDLPGKQPWSVRFKYILLMPSVCIKLTQITKYTDSKIIEDEWVSYINKFVEPNKDYIDVRFECIDNKIDFKKLGEKVKIAKERKDSLRKNQVNKITMNTIYESLKNTIIEYSKLFPIKKLN